MSTMFRIIRARTADDAYGLFAEQPQASRFYSGGVQLIPVLRAGDLREVDVLIDVKRVPDLLTHRLGHDALRLGAALSLRTVATSALVTSYAPALAAVAASVGNPRVRTTGTLGGNIAARVSESDVRVVLAAIGARVEIVGADGTSDATIEDWLQERAVPAAPLLTAIKVPRAHFRSHVEYGRFPASGSASAAVAAVYDSRGPDSRLTKLVAGCAGGPPVVVSVPPHVTLDGDDETEAVEYLQELVMTSAVVRDAAWASADYRRHLLGVLTRRVTSRMSTREEGNRR